jgi:glyoxylase-like metal-dependent hydrolase (beta-lactamase superfamily II)
MNTRAKAAILRILTGLLVAMSWTTQADSFNSNTEWFSKAEDYTAGELNEPLQVFPTERWLEGSQWHALTYLGDTWGRRNTRFIDAQWVEWARKVIAHGGVLTLDMGPNYDRAKGPVGLLDETQVSQVKAIRQAIRPAANHTFQPLELKGETNLFVWKDTCNVYVVRDREAALLIDLGDGSVLDHLADIGVQRVEWVLFTGHHRELCQGAPRLRGTGARLAGPEAERALFERPVDFRKMEVTLNDAFTVYGASYVRPPIQPIPLDHPFKTNDVFNWHGREFQCLSTPGNSPGGMSYVLQQATGPLAFSGDAMLDGAVMYTWFDTEWDYGFGAGIRALRQSVTNLTALGAVELLPAHGASVRQPKEQLDIYQTKLARLERLYVRGYDVEAGSVAYQDKVSTPTVVSNVVQVSPHLFKFKRPNFWPNFGLILADSGRALVVDCGLLEEKFLDTALGGMREHFGLKAIDAAIITHMHGDHFLEASHLRETWGTKIWALDNMVDKMEHPEWFEYAAPIQAYEKKASDGSRIKGVRVDRAFKPGETFTWEGYRFTVDWMPGQTEFALCLHGQIDGRHVAFTGDNIFGDPDNPSQTGHEAMVAHNSAILEEGYIYGSEYLKRIQPDLLVGGHSFVMAHPAAFIERYRRWSYEMRDAFRAVSSDPEYRYWFDPFWARPEPYRVTLSPGQAKAVNIHLRNFRSREQSHHIEFHTPPGLQVEPTVLEGRLSPESRTALPILIKAESNVSAGVRIVALDIRLDGKRYGEWFDIVVEVAP